MPEGPEIRRAADRLERALRGQVLTRVQLERDDLRAFAPQLLGSRVTRVDTRGKAMLTRFDNGLSLYSHNQLYGRWYVVRSGQQPRTGRSLRVGLHTDKNSALLYSATDISVLAPGDEDTHPFLSRIGPDVLDPLLDSGDIEKRLNEPRFRRRALASLYLDQGFLAGIGNYLRSEILYFARVHPQARPADLDRNARRRVARQTLIVTLRSYRTGGITNRAGRAARLQAAGAGYEDRRFAAYSRADRPCYQCGSKIRRREFATRAVFFCPACQRLRKLRHG